jgi:hypothetical protein
MSYGIIDVSSLRPEYQFSMGDPATSIGGVSFSPLSFFGQASVMSGLPLTGTIPVSYQPLQPDEQFEVVFTFPDAYVDDAYARIRLEMIASGIPMLSDEELRREIRERKGGEPEN